MVTFSDEEIGELIAVSKVGVGKRPGLPSLRRKRGHFEAHADFKGDDGSEFRVVLRRSSANQMSFSAILMVRPRRSSRWFRLRRYNGAHTHQNRIEGDRFRGFHIHTATERYQRAGRREDTYAEPTDRFSDFEGAVRCLVQDAGLPTILGRNPNQLGLPLEDGR